MPSNVIPRRAYKTKDEKKKKKMTTAATNAEGCRQFLIAFLS